MSSASEPLIEPASEEHLPAIAALAGVVWRAHYPGIISAEQIDYMLGRMYSLETLRADLRERGVRFLRLTVDGELAGYAAFGPIEEPATMKLHKLYVHPARQRGGLGSRLLRRVEELAREAGASQLILSVNKRNEKALAAYFKNGFQVREAVVLDCGSGFVMDDFILVKSLS